MIFFNWFPTGRCLGWFYSFSHINDAAFEYFCMYVILHVWKYIYKVNIWVWNCWVKEYVHLSEYKKE